MCGRTWAARRAPDESQDHKAEGGKTGRKDHKGRPRVAFVDGIQQGGRKKNKSQRQAHASQGMAPTVLLSLWHGAGTKKANPPNACLQTRTKCSLKVIIDGSQSLHGPPGHRLGTKQATKGHRQQHSCHHKENCGHRKAGKHLGRVFGALQCQSSKHEDDAAKEQQEAGRKQAALLGQEGLSRGGHFVL